MNSKSVHNRNPLHVQQPSPGHLEHSYPERDPYINPLCRASFSASIAAPRAPAVSPFGIT
jgi:hypothetical protein